MPTPSVEEPVDASVAPVLRRSSHATCPPEDDRSSAAAPAANEHIVFQPAADDGVLMPLSDPGEAVMRHSADCPELSPASHHDHDGDLDMGRRGAAPTSFGRDSPVISDSGDDVKIDLPRPSSARAQAPSIVVPSTLRHAQSSVPQSMLPYASSFLRNGSKFVGTQQSDRQVYKVQVEIKHVDMAESFICGYLRIEGLTNEHPTLTTYFEGEIIGTKYTFQTRHAEWGSNEKVDMHHWNRFPAWKPLARQARRQPDFSFRDYASRDALFMRWKEYFLVPDHRVRTINGASFEGFYYICFSQVKGTVSGIYFHSKSEKYQQLELRHVDDRGCTGAMEFR